MSLPVFSIAFFIDTLNVWVDNLDLYKYVQAAYQLSCCVTNINPSNAKATFVKSKRMQRFLKNT